MSDDLNKKPTADDSEQPSGESCQGQKQEPPAPNDNEELQSSSSSDASSDAASFRSGHAAGESKSVLVVHGHHPVLKEAVVVFLTELGIKPILSQHKGNAFIPLAQKAKEYRDIQFVIVILYGDDLTYPKEGKPADALLCASQKVVFELGFWLGKLDRDRVFVLYHEKKRFRRPTEYHDVYYTSYDNKGCWKKDLIDRLNHCGLKCNPS